MGEGGVPPLSVKFFFVKNRPKNSVFWAKNAVFGGNCFEFRPLWGGVPPISLFFCVKKRPVNSVFWAKMMFLAENFSNSVR